MELVIDKLGRVVIPKAARERLGLAAGSKISAEFVGDGLMLKPVLDEGELVEEDGVLVYSPKVSKHTKKLTMADLNAIVDETRDRHLHRMVRELRKRRR